MGYAQRENARTRAATAASAAAVANRLVGLKVAVDVQHLYRTGQHAGDRGSVFTLASGAKLAETQATVPYAQALTAWLRSRGAAVLTNEPVSGILTGPYSRRNIAAGAWGAHAYLACHLNAGGGSYALAEYLVPTAGQALGAAVVGVLANRFREIRGTKVNPLMPDQRGAVCLAACPPAVTAIVCEPFFGDNPLQQALLAHDRLVAVGEAIGEGVAIWWERARK